MAKTESGGSRLTEADRNAVVKIVAQGTNNLHEAYFDAPNWGHARRYMNLVAMVGSLASETMTRPQKNHVKRMIAHKVISLPKGGKKPLSEAEFMEQAEAVAGKEIKFLQSAQNDNKPLNLPYTKAKEDLEKVDKKTVTDPILLTLRRSLRRSKEHKTKK